MSTYSSDMELPEDPDGTGQWSVSVSASSVDRNVRLDMENCNTGEECFMTPEYAEQLAAALVRQAQQARRYDK